MNSKRGALVRGSDPPSGRRVHTMVGVMWRVLVRRMIKHLVAGVHKTDDKIYRSISNGKKYVSFQVWDKIVGNCRQALAL